MVASAVVNGAKIARVSIKAQDINNFEMVHQNDLEEVSRKIMFKEI